MQVCVKSSSSPPPTEKKSVLNFVWSVLNWLTGYSKILKVVFFIFFLCLIECSYPRSYPLLCQFLMTIIIVTNLVCKYIKTSVEEDDFQDLSKGDRERECVCVL